MACTLVIRDLVGLDIDGDGERDQLVVVGTVEGCMTVTVRLPSDSVEASAEILPAEEGVFGVAPAATERVFLGRFALTDTTVFKGDCGSVLRLVVEASCATEPDCRTTVNWAAPVRCESELPPSDCPDIILTTHPKDCVGEERLMTLVVRTVPFEAGTSAQISFGHDDPQTGLPATATVALEQVDGLTLGEAVLDHLFPAANSGTTTATVEVRVGRCSERFPVEVEACGPPSKPACPEVQLAGAADLGCDEDGNRRVEIRISLDPAHSGMVRINYGNGGERTVPGAAEIVVVLPYAANWLDEPLIRIVPLAADGTAVCERELRLPIRLDRCWSPPPASDDPPPGNPTEEPDPRPTGFDPCLLGLVVVIALLLAAGVTAVVGACLADLTTIVVAIVLAVVALAALIVWMLLCGRIRCDLLRWLIFMLAVLAAASFALASIIAVIGRFIPGLDLCALGAAATFAYYGTIGFFVTLVAIQLGCYVGSTVFPWEVRRASRRTP